MKTMDKNTTQNEKEAKKIAQVLLEHKSAACVNIIENIESFFWWQGKPDKAKEMLLIAKSKKQNFNKIIKLVKSLHSYEVPEIIALPVAAGYKPYLKWIDESLKS